MLPALNQLCIRGEIHRLDLLPERSKRASARDFRDSPRAPLGICALTSKASAYELSGSLPFRETCLDPALVPVVSLVNFLNRDRTRERHETGKHLALRGTRSHHRVTQYRGNDFACVELDLVVDEAGAAAPGRRHQHCAHGITSER